MMDKLFITKPLTEAEYQKIKEEFIKLQSRPAFLQPVIITDNPIEIILPNSIDPTDYNDYRWMPGLDAQ